VYVPGGVAARKRIQKPRISLKLLDECISTITLSSGIPVGNLREQFEKWASDLCAILLNYFSMETIKETEDLKYVFPLGQIYPVGSRVKREFYEFTITFNYDTKNRTKISNIISDLDQFGWTGLTYGFRKRFDHTKIVNWLKNAEMNMESYTPGSRPAEQMSITVLAKGWGRDGVPATVTFKNHGVGSKLTIKQKMKMGFDSMEPNFFDKLNPQNILGLLKEILVEVKK